MNNCKEPTCFYSKSKKKCIKPNAYTQYISHCKKQEISFEDCKTNYKKNVDDIKKNSCKYYLENQKNKNINSSCPKKRQPINDVCPEEFKVLKINKYKIPCCYKEKKIVETDKYSDIFKESSNKYLNKEKGKLFNVKKYTKKLKPYIIK